MEPTPAEVEAREQNRHEYEQRPERKENKLRHAQAKRQEAKSLGLCVACGAPPIPGQTRCFSCGEPHRQSRRRSDAMRRAAARQAATTDKADQ